MRPPNTVSVYVQGQSSFGVYVQFGWHSNAVEEITEEDRAALPRSADVRFTRSQLANFDSAVRKLAEVLPQDPLRQDRARRIVRYLRGILEVGAESLHIGPMLEN